MVPASLAQLTRGYNLVECLLPKNLMECFRMEKKEAKKRIYLFEIQIKVYMQTNYSSSIEAMSLFNDLNLYHDERPFHLVLYICLTSLNDYILRKAEKTIHFKTICFFWLNKMLVVFWNSS